MNDFRKNMHIAYEKKLFEVIYRYMCELGETEEDLQKYTHDPKSHLENWIDRNCLPMGDFSKEDAIKEIDAWQK